MEEQKGQNLDYGRGGRSPKSPVKRDTAKADPAIKGYDKDGKPVKSDKPQLSRP
jgi:hypothetical protein